MNGQGLTPSLIHPFHHKSEGCSMGTDTTSTAAFFLFWQSIKRLQPACGGEDLPPRYMDQTFPEWAEGLTPAHQERLAALRARLGSCVTPSTYWEMMIPRDRKTRFTVYAG